MRILVLANVVPYPAYGGIHLRIFNLLKRAAQAHEVTLGCHFWGGDEERAGAEYLTQIGIRTVLGRIVPGSVRAHGVRAALALLRGEPPELVQFEVPELHDLVRAGAYDLLQIEETTLTRYLRSLPASRTIPTVLTLHNLHFVQERRLVRVERGLGLRAWRALNARLMERYEPEIAERCSTCIVMSDEDARALRARAPSAQIAVVPNGVDTAALTPLPAPTEAEEPALIFVGTMSYRPCADAVEWFVRRLWAPLRARHPRLRLFIVGTFPPPEIVALVGNGVVVTGRVDDVRPYYTQATLAIAPLRAGGGSRLKILEAMALGRPVISTTVGAEGLRVRAGEEIEIADGESAWLAQIDRLLTDPARRESLAKRARQLVEDSYDWDRVASAQAEAYARVTER